ncbi:Panacea domain-containing protein [Campylobacter cuniculorum]|uniref:Panacea domain-containing protein n=1 Tax=Campylobacter cuniculorum TaxID=374106 RepID=UPI0023F19F7B|nr:type II toxin-antitoxin system antitoxin SocA domain-containing protein [Campylobacter cuniculorum]
MKNNDVSNRADRDKILAIAVYFLYLNKLSATKTQEGINENDRENPDEITKLKLIKLVYYANALSLVYLEKPLFKEAIEAWKHGPVIASLYDELKQYKKENLMNISSLNDYERYSQYLTDEENKNNIIPNDEIREYFKQVQEQKTQDLYEKSEEFRCLFKS